MPTDIPFKHPVDSGRYQQVLRGDDISNLTVDKSVFSPKLIESPPHSESYYLLFRANDRVYSIPIDSTLSVETDNAAVVAQPSDVNGEKINSFDALWDGQNDEWVLMASVGNSKPNDGYLIAVSESDNSWSVSSTSAIVSGLNDGGMSGYHGNGTKVFFTAVDNSSGNLEFYEIDDITARPLPGSPATGPLTYLKNEGRLAAPVNHQTIRVGQATNAILYESNSDAGWTTQIAYGGVPRPDLTVDVLAGTAETHPLQSNGYNNGPNLTHPEFSTILGRPVVLGQQLTARGIDLDYGIYAYEPDDQLFDPANQLPLRLKVSDSVSSSYESGWIPTFGASKIIVHIKSSTTGTLRLNESNAFFETGGSADNTQNVSIGSRVKGVFNDPMHWVQFDPNASMNKLMATIVP